MKNITIYTDGGCRGNGKTTNIGAYAFIVKDEAGNTNEISESFDNTTNNQMELLGLIKGLESLPLKSRVTAYSDSKYVCDAINNGWINNWLKNGWKTSKKEPVKNKDLWERLIAISKQHDITINWVKGHSNDMYNNRCDELANEAMYNHIVNNESTNLDIDSFNNIFPANNSLISNITKTSNIINSSKKDQTELIIKLLKLKGDLDDIIKDLLKDL